MKKNVLNEVNKIREMMGLINEQVTTKSEYWELLNDVRESPDFDKGGCVWGDCENGVGVFNNKTYKGSSGRLDYLYAGEWKNGKFDGNGVMVPYGMALYSYEGEFKDGKRHGKGLEREGNVGNSTKIRNQGTWENDEFIGNEDKSTPTSFPENWIDGINNKGWLIQKGTHAYEGRIPNTENAIKLIQSIVGANPDGVFGSETEEKVKEWQTSNGLTPDGKIGKNTLTKMLD